LKYCPPELLPDIFRYFKIVELALGLSISSTTGREDSVGSIFSTHILCLTAQLIPLSNSSRK